VSNVIAPPASWQHEQVGETETVEQLIRRAQNVVGGTAPSMSMSKMSRLIRKRIATRGAASARAMVDAYCLSYADPTGETAVRNMMAVTR
jgi:hypothetical protein